MQFLSQCDPSNKKALLRLDLDLPQNEAGEFDTSRLEGGLASLEYLWHGKALTVTVIAHRGIEDETKKEKYSLFPIAEVLYKELAEKLHCEQEELREWLTVKENLRFDPREQEGSEEFARELATGFDLFVNDAFATAHRKHTSIVFISKILPTFFGIQFEKEIVAFEKVFTDPARPYIFILGGGKLETKLPLLEEMAKTVDKILIGGKLAVEAAKGTVQMSDLLKQKMIVATVTKNTLDISQSSANEFAQSISAAKTIVWNGPMGHFEDGVHAAGTKVVGEAVAAATQAGAFSMIGGGDTEAALTILNLEKPANFSHISSGGGAMMEYLATRKLEATS